jgi:RNA polymerase sigma factor (sigma-70 family)
MVKENVITQESFDLLLDWLDPNREAAGEKYEKIRQRLIRIYLGRGCYEAEDLADEVMSRVAQKLPEIVKTYIGEPVRYFYGVAENIHREWLRKQKRRKNLPPAEIGTYQEPDTDSEYDCLEKCLKKLPEVHRELIIDYYREEKSAKILHRQTLAAKLKISINALQIKTSRIRAKLEDCIRSCMAANNQ